MTPVERAARSLYYEEANDSDGFDAWTQWESHDNPTRDIWRLRARSMFDDAIDVDELARVADAVFHEWWNDPDEPRFGPLYARAVRTYLLTGDESDE